MGRWLHPHRICLPSKSRFYQRLPYPLWLKFPDDWNLWSRLQLYWRHRSPQRNSKARKSPTHTDKRSLRKLIPDKATHGNSPRKTRSARLQLKRPTRRLPGCSNGQISWWIFRLELFDCWHFPLIPRFLTPWKHRNLWLSRSPSGRFD